jgi:hypothetical protein
MSSATLTGPIGSTVLTARIRPGKRGEERQVVVDAVAPFAVDDQAVAVLGDVPVPAAVPFQAEHGAPVSAEAQ